MIKVHKFVKADKCIKRYVNQRLNVYYGIITYCNQVNSLDSQSGNNIKDNQADSYNQQKITKQT